MANPMNGREEYINSLLNLSRRSWSSLPEVEKNIANWDYDEQLPYLEEWHSEELYLERLAEAYKAREMTSGQEEQYQRLLKLVEQNRPIIERIHNHP